MELDSATMVVDSLRAFTIEHHHEPQLDSFAVGSQAIFGYESSLVPFDAPTDSVLSYIDAVKATVPWGSTLMVLILLAIYCGTFYRYSAMVRWSIKSAFSIKDTLMLFESQSLDYLRFLRLTNIVWTVTVSSCLSMLLHPYLPSKLSVFIIFGGVMVIVSLLELWTRVFRLALSKLDYNSLRWSRLEQMVRYHKSLLTMVLGLPIVFLSLLPHTREIVLYTILICCIYYIIRFFLYFKLSGFSFLQSFFYLCIVEVAPILVVVSIVATKNLL